MLAKDHEIDKIDDKLAKDYGKLIPAHERATDIGRRYLRYVHRTNGGCKADTNTADNSVDVEDHKKSHVRDAFFV